jgi:hypothetical protein
VLDLNGIYCRAAVAHFANGKTRLSLKSAVVKNLIAMKTKGFTEHELLSKQSEFIHEIKLPEKSQVGYCFSYLSKV